MYIVVLAVIAIFVIIVVYNYINILTFRAEPIIHPLKTFDNSDVPLIEPSTEIIIESNPIACHKTLTPCLTHSDCDVCREGLANCQYFDERTKISINDRDVWIEPGESYCMALNRERARSCNPNTGVWVLAESETGFSLLCNCLTPGLITQLSMYEDCNVPVGCQPNGQILDINQFPLRCHCEEGFVSDFISETQTPYCRPQKLRDVIYNEGFFPRAPCPQGYVRLDHPALNESYRQELRLNDLCIIDPCSVDPINGHRVEGQLEYYKSGTVELKYCRCPLGNNLFGVYSPGLSMLGVSNPIQVTNACIKPFNVIFGQVPRIEYKFFWARSDNLLSDDDIVAYVRKDQVSINYERFLFDASGAHPQLSLSNLKILKFSTAFSPSVPSSHITFNSLYQLYINLEAKISEPCFRPGDGRCITMHPTYCIRRHNNAAVGSAEFFGNDWCYLSREGPRLTIWSNAQRYPTGKFPAVLRCNMFFAILPNNNELATVYIIFADRIFRSITSLNNFAQVIQTFSNYSIH